MGQARPGLLRPSAGHLLNILSLKYEFTKLKTPLGLKLAKLRGNGFYIAENRPL